MRHWGVAIAATTLAGCGAPSWPNDHFPAEVEIARVLFAEEDAGLREICIAMVAELTDRSATRLVGHVRRVENKLIATPPEGWLASPIPRENAATTYYNGAFGGCNSEGRRPLGDLGGALNRAGAYYKVMNHGEGIGIILPREKVVAFFYFG